MGKRSSRCTKVKIRWAGYPPWADESFDEVEDDAAALDCDRCRAASATDLEHTQPRPRDRKGEDLAPACTLTAPKQMGTSKQTDEVRTPRCQIRKVTPPNRANLPC